MALSIHKEVYHTEGYCPASTAEQVAQSFLARKIFLPFFQIKEYSKDETFLYIRTTNILSCGGIQDGLRF
jgi:hypothetical protein